MRNLLLKRPVRRLHDGDQTCRDKGEGRSPACPQYVRDILSYAGTAGFFFDPFASG